MAATEHETKRIVGQFLQPPLVGDLFVNADRQTEVVPRYKVTKVNAKSVRLEGVDRNLNFVVRVQREAYHKFRKADEENQ